MVRGRHSTRSSFGISCCISMLVAIAVSLHLFPTKAYADAVTMPACKAENTPDCRNGNKWALVITQPNIEATAYAHVGNPGCIDDVHSQVDKFIQGIVVATEPDLSMFSGIIGTILAVPVNNYLRHQGGDIGKIFSPYAGKAATCVGFVAAVPADATVYRSIQLAATDSNNGNRFLGCEAGKDCPIGWCRFDLNNPNPLRKPGVQIFSGVFKNWARTRTARIMIFYSLPEGESPGSKGASPKAHSSHN